MLIPIDSNLTLECLNLQESYEKKYGPKTIVFVQVGKFHEAYSTETRGFDLKILEQILNTTFTRKNSKKKVSEKNPYMLGFPSVQLASKINNLVDNGYIAVIYSQVNTKKCKLNEKVNRKLDGIYSPGTYINDKTSFESNYLMSIIICEEKQLDGKILMAIGITLLDTSIGTSIVHEFYSNSNDEKYGLDELTRMIQYYSPTETIIYFKPLKLSDSTINNIKNYLELEKYIHFFYVYHDKHGSDLINLLDENSFKINFQNEYLSTIFNLNKKISAVQTLDLNTRPYCVVSLMIILRFVTEHDISLLKNLSYPQIYIFNKHLILGNNAVEQLNIIDSNNLESYNKKFNSLFSVINKTSTPMGKRLLKNNLTNPLSQVEKKIINHRYDLIEKMINTGCYTALESELKNILDMERFHRKMAMQTINPYEFHRLDDFYRSTTKIIGILKKNNILVDLISESQIKKFIDYQNDYNKIFNVDQMLNNFADLNNSFFKEKYNDTVDAMQNKINCGLILLRTVSSELDKLIRSNFKTQNIKTVTHKDNEHYLTITAAKEKILKKAMKDNFKIEVQIPNGPIIEIKSENLIFKSLPTKTKTKIYIDIDNNPINVNMKSELIILLTEKFIQTITELYDNHRKILSVISDFVAYVDFLVSGAVVAKKYYYNKPSIPSILDNDQDTSSYIKTKQLRHAVIERLCENVEYVPNDIDIGNIRGSTDKNGLLVYGINSAGKSSFMKSIGIAIVLAQIGYFVPAQSFIYEPYMSVYARITGNDNMLKGLSSFALEMSELDAILKRTSTNGSNTLVIGDEVCRGTEIISAKSIVAATLCHLSENNTTYIFSSHLHDLPDIPEVQKLKNLRVYHLLSHYDVKTDCIIHGRKLENGKGPSDYGLMVAKYLIKDNKFIVRSEKIKQNLIGIVPPIHKKTSNYNKNLIMTKCSICYYAPTETFHKELETHHINFQSNCNADNKIKNKPHIDKDALSNLVVLCRKCHESVHNKEIHIEGYIDTTIGPLLNYKIDHNRKIDIACKKIQQMDKLIKYNSVTNNH